MATATLQMTGTRWRLINALSGAARSTDSGQVRAANLVSDQDATDDDLRWMAASGLIKTTMYASETRIDLIEHLNHHGSTMVLGVALNSRGRQLAAQPANRVLRNLFYASGRVLRVDKLMGAASADRILVETMTRAKKIALIVRSSGDRIEADAARQLPDATLVAQLTPKGRQYLPLDA
jgi:hypothetical protein